MMPLFRLGTLLSFTVSGRPAGNDIALSTPREVSVEAELSFPLAGITDERSLRNESLRQTGHPIILP